MSPVTIDPEDNQVMAWLAKKLDSPNSVLRTVLDQLAAAAESPREPEAVCAAVVDASKRTWTSVSSHKTRWVTGNHNGGHDARDWLDLWHPVTVLHEGYTPEAES